MSCNWHLYCKTCNEQLGLGELNHQERAVFQLIQYRHTLAQLAPVELGDVLKLSVTIGWNDYPIDLAWVRKHHEHELRAQDEYNSIAEDTCSRCKKPAATRPFYDAHITLGYYCEDCRKWLRDITKVTT